MVRQLAHELGLALQDIRALLLDPVDIRGLPYLGPDGRSKWAAPDFLPSDGAGILFLDELNAAPWSGTPRLDLLGVSDVEGHCRQGLNQKALPRTSCAPRCPLNRLYRVTSLRS